MKKTFLILSCMALFSFVQAQETGSKTKEVIIEKKVKKPVSSKMDSSMNVTVMINGDTTENISVVVDGDKITINGEAVNSNDPRLKKVRKGAVKGMTFQAKPNSAYPEANTFIFKKAPQSNRAFLGVVTEKVEAGVRIVEISAQSPASIAKLNVGDIISSVDEEKITDPEVLYTTIGKYKPNDMINLGYTRANKFTKVKIKLVENPKKHEDIALATPESGLEELELLDQKGGQFKFSFPELPNMDQLMTRADRRPKLGISVEDVETGKGVKVTNVTEASPAAKAGILKEDVLIKLNESEIPDVNFMKWQYYFPGQILKITLDRKGEKRTMEVKIPKKINTADL
jgi:serine protease Do